jgi:protease I
MTKVAILVDELFEDSELRIPLDRLRAAGVEVELVGLRPGAQVHGKQGKETVTIERAVKEAQPSEYDALVIPGGYSPDHLRTDLEAVRFTRAMTNANKTVAAVCHGPSLLIEADVVDGMQLTSWPSIQTDLINAGARWIDRQVVVDGNLITSRRPDDLEAFSGAILAQLERGVPERVEPASAPPPSKPDGARAHAPR